jgi:RNA recognition motif-containing protein
MGDIKPWMTEIFIINSFNQFGFKPKSIKLIKDKKYNFPLNYCFVNFDTFSEANQALNKLNGIKIPNNNFYFKLNWANKNFENYKSVYVANIPLQAKDTELYNFFKKKYESVLHATIIRETQCKKNYGFVYISKEDEYQKCLKEMNGVNFFNSNIKVKERKKKILEEKKVNNFNINININEIKSYYPKKKENENLESNETNSSSEEETKKISKRKFSDNLLILESNDQPLINQNIQKSVNKMFNYYKNSNEISGMILYYGSNINNNEKKEN